MSLFTVLCDIDVTVAPSDVKWAKWLESVTGCKLPSKNKQSKICYDLTTYVKKELSYNGITGFEFWGMEGIYDDMEPVEGSVDALKSIVAIGGRLVFVSHEMGLHGASKRGFIARHFPFATTTILTKEVKGFNTKSLVKGDYFIEDRYEGLQDFSKGFIKGVILNTPYINPRPLGIRHTVCDDWTGVKDYFFKELFVCTP